MGLNSYSSEYHLIIHRTRVIVYLPSKYDTCSILAQHAFTGIARRSRGTVRTVVLSEYYIDNRQPPTCSCCLLGCCFRGPLLVLLCSCWQLCIFANLSEYYQLAVKEEIAGLRSSCGLARSPPTSSCHRKRAKVRTSRARRRKRTTIRLAVPPTAPNVASRCRRQTRWIVCAPVWFFAVQRVLPKAMFTSVPEHPTLSLICNNA